MAGSTTLLTHRAMPGKPGLGNRGCSWMTATRYALSATCRPRLRRASSTTSTMTSSENWAFRLETSARRKTLLEKESPELVPCPVVEGGNAVTRSMAVRRESPPLEEPWISRARSKASALYVHLINRQQYGRSRDVHKNDFKSVHRIPSPNDAIACLGTPSTHPHRNRPYAAQTRLLRGPPAQHSTPAIMSLFLKSTACNAHALQSFCFTGRFPSQVLATCSKYTAHCLDLDAREDEKDEEAGFEGCGGGGGCCCCS